VEYSAFSSDHGKIRKLIVELSDSHKNEHELRSILYNLQKRMILHFYREETYVFQMASTLVQHAFILGLETEHAGLIRLLDKILSYMESNDHERAMDRIEGLSRLFTLHCIREENEIYSVLKDRNAIDGLVEQVKYKRVPRNWQCAVTKKYDRK